MSEGHYTLQMKWKSKQLSIAFKNHKKDPVVSICWEKNIMVQISDLYTIKSRATKTVFIFSLELVKNSRQPKQSQNKC